ncbi:MAG: hypothetical protein KGK14_08785 [Bacteroidota bacterium]|nr:hypothetical protein [Bacteroidota bacterium]
MPNRNSDPLFLLIQSLQKSEKRHFKLYIKRSSNKEDLKIVQLFDALEKMPDYDEKNLLKRLSNINKPQLANLKTHLYKQVLASLRLLKSTDSIDLQLNEQLDYARILYNKGLFLQSLKILERAKEMAKTANKFNFMTQVLSLEKKIETLHITRSMPGKTMQITAESIKVSEHVTQVSALSNLALHLYTWYIKNGHARNVQDETDVKLFFKENLPENAYMLTGFYERLYLYQSYTWYAFIRQDFLMYYRYSEKWLGLFDEQPNMIAVETGHYIKGLHNLLNAHFDLRNFDKFQIILQRFEAFSITDLANQHDNFRIQTFIYIHSAKINWYLMTGTFEEGLTIIPAMEAEMQKLERFIDAHRILVFNYKIASLYFGSRQFAKCIDYLQKIINDNFSLRNDLQCYARLMHLLAHYEMGNFDILESLIKSVYRYMARMQNLTIVEEEIFAFLRRSFFVGEEKLDDALQLLLSKIKHLEKNRFETRAFAYLDIISWVESKVYHKTMSEIIYDKYKASKKRRYGENEI